MFNKVPKKSVFPQRTALQLTDFEPNEFGETMMHDVNIEETMKMKVLISVRRSQIPSPTELSR